MTVDDSDVKKIKNGKQSIYFSSKVKSDLGKQLHSTHIILFIKSF